MNTSPTVFPRERSKGLNIALWAVQVLLAAMFLLSGSMKLMHPPVSMMSAGLAYFIGTAELLGGIGVLLPSITRIKPQISAVAAMGLGSIMICATVFHIAKGQANVIGITLFIAALAFFVAWGRLIKAPIQSK